VRYARTLVLQNFDSGFPVGSILDGLHAGKLVNLNPICWAANGPIV
jgi:hypothetical protein